MKQWHILLCLLLFSCSCSMFIAERPVEDAYVVVTELSDDGLIKQEINRIRLPYAATGKSDMVIRDNRLYIGSYGRLHILEHDANGNLQMSASLPVPGHDTAIALHPEEPILYMTNSKGLFVVDVKDAANPKLAKHLLFATELERISGGEWSAQIAGLDLACENNKLVVAVETDFSSSAGTTLIFDISKPLAPQIESTLSTPSNTSAVAMGLVEHQMFAAGDKMIEYRNFHPDPRQLIGSSDLHASPDGITFPSDRVPGDVVEMKFVMGPLGLIKMGSEEIVVSTWGRTKDYEINPEKLEEIIQKYRHGDAEERQRL